MAAVRILIIVFWSDMLSNGPAQPQGRQLPQVQCAQNNVSPRGNKRQNVLLTVNGWLQKRKCVKPQTNTLGKFTRT